MATMQVQINEINGHAIRNASTKARTHRNSMPPLRLPTLVRIHVPQDRLPGLDVPLPRWRLGDGKPHAPPCKEHDAARPEAHAHEDDEEGEEGDKEAERHGVLRVE